jgi:uncharacterized cupin superfamily protein
MVAAGKIMRRETGWELRIGSLMAMAWAALMLSSKACPTD